MGLGHNDPWVESHMWPQQTCRQRSCRGQWPLVQVFGKKDQCIHILWCIFKSNITMIAKVCDRESRRDSWFENCLVWENLILISYLDGTRITVRIDSIILGKFEALLKIRHWKSCLITIITSTVHPPFSLCNFGWWSVQFCQNNVDFGAKVWHLPFIFKNKLFYTFIHESNWRSLYLALCWWSNFHISAGFLILAINYIEEDVWCVISMCSTNEWM